MCMKHHVALIAKKSGALKGQAKVPGDKSISHRALMLGGLAIGETIISGLLESEDVYCTADAMQSLGAKVARGDDGLWRVFGTGIGGLKEPDHVIDMGNSGTSTRLLMGVIGSHPISTTMTGDASLVKRPMGRVITPLQQMGTNFIAREGGRLPLSIKGAENTMSIEYTLPIASAQVKSAVLLAGLNAAGKTTVIEPEPTRDHTENMLKHFGVDVQIDELGNGRRAIHVQGQQELQPGAVDVPADPSSAAFPAVAALLNEGSELTIPRVCVSETRIGLYKTLQEMGAEIELKNQRTESGEPLADIVVRGTGALKGIDVDPARVASMIDEFPILAMAAACANGTTRMTNLAELRVKESDRLLMVARGLEACGVKLEMGEDSLTIHGTGKPPKGGAVIETALDHRIAMSFLVLGTTTDEPIEIDDAAPIKTSFPDFVKLMQYLGADISETEQDVVLEPFDTSNQTITQLS